MAAKVYFGHAYRPGNGVAAVTAVFRLADRIYAASRGGKKKDEGSPLGNIPDTFLEAIRLKRLLFVFDFCASLENAHPACNR